LCIALTFQGAVCDILGNIVTLLAPDGIDPFLFASIQNDWSSAEASCNAAKMVCDFTANKMILVKHAVDAGELRIFINDTH
jgi:hypothetical protein